MENNMWVFLIIENIYIVSFIPRNSTYKESNDPAEFYQ